MIRFALFITLLLLLCFSFLASIFPLHASYDLGVNKLEYDENEKSNIIAEFYHSLVYWGRERGRQTAQTPSDYFSPVERLGSKPAIYLAKPHKLINFDKFKLAKGLKGRGLSYKVGLQYFDKLNQHEGVCLVREFDLEVMYNLYSRSEPYVYSFKLNTGDVAWSLPINVSSEHDGISFCKDHKIDITSFSYTSLGDYREIMKLFNDYKPVINCYMAGFEKTQDRASCGWGFCSFDLNETTPDLQSLINNLVEIGSLPPETAPIWKKQNENLCKSDNLYMSKYNFKDVTGFFNYKEFHNNEDSLLGANLFLTVKSKKEKGSNFFQDVRFYFPKNIVN